MDIRLDKFVADRGALTRREAVRHIVRGDVTVDGIICRQPALKIPDTAAVSLSERPLSADPLVYLMLHKPAGVLSAARDSRQRTVLDLLPPELRRKGLFPIGRLDKDTTGLLLLTNDGDYAHRLLSPRSGVSKHYRAVLDRAPDAAEIRRFKENLILSDGTVCRSAELVISTDAVDAVYTGGEPDSGAGAVIADVVLYEGKYHQVRRMFAAVGCHVVRLARLSVGGLVLDPALKPGEARLLSAEEAALAEEKDP
jgi:16S rRNA pseudouridine516 synthase